LDLDAGKHLVPPEVYLHPIAAVLAKRSSASLSRSRECR
jgi:hypothetical protein